jgi:hypothetical protein
MAYVGLLVPSVEVINNASFMVIFPLTFVANTFVPLENLPGAAAHLRRVEPGLGGHPGGRASCSATPMIAAARSRPPEVWSLQHPVAYTLMWVVGHHPRVVFVPLSVDVHEDNIGSVAHGGDHAQLAVAGLGHDVDARLAGDDERHAGAHEFLIVHQNGPDGRSRGRPRGGIVHVAAVTRRSGSSASTRQV